MIIENGILKECKRLEKDITEMRNDEYHGPYEGGDVEIPLGVETVGGDMRHEDYDRFDHNFFYPAFIYNRRLLSVKFAESVTIIGAKAFEHCSNLHTVSFPKGLKRIEISAFLGCSSLTDIHFRESIEYIDEWAFAFCPKLVVHCHKKTVAEQYAKDNNIPLVYED